MFIDEYGTLGIDSIDRCHYNMDGCSQNQLIDIFNNVVTDDIHQVREVIIFPILVQFENKDSSLKSRYGSKFSSNTLQKLK